MTALLGPVAGRIFGLAARKPWEGVALAQGWLQEMADIPARVLVDVWPVLRKLGVADFPVLEDMHPVEVLDHATEHMRRLQIKADLGMEVDAQGRARILASVDVTEGVDGALYWVDMAAVEALRWTAPELYPVALRGCAVLWKCGLSVSDFGDMDLYLDYYVENYEGEDAEAAATRAHHQEVVDTANQRIEHWVDEMERSGLADLDALQDAARELGEDWESWARNLAQAARIVGNLWDCATDNADGEPFYVLFQLVVGPHDFTDFMEMVTNDQATNVGVAQGRISRPLSRWGRRGGLERVEREGERLRQGFFLLAEAIEQLNLRIGAWEDFRGEE